MTHMHKKPKPDSRMTIRLTTFHHETYAAIVNGGPSIVGAGPTPGEALIDLGTRLVAVDGEDSNTSEVAR